MRTAAPPSLPTFADIERAARQIAGVAHRTPVVTSTTIDARTNARVFFKCEMLQRAGAFKFRGAYNALSQLDANARRRGVIAYSSGNHAQAVALAGQLLDIPRVIVMPSDSPEVKRAATAGYSAEIILYDRETENREAITARLAETRGLTLVPPFDHPDIIAGAGTVALELLQEVGDLDLLLVPCGGGGLLSGSGLVTRAVAPACLTIGVEPATADDAARSFRTGELQSVHNPRTVADGARTASLGTLTFPLVLSQAHDIVTVDDRALLQTTFLLWERMKLLVEPTGALGAAALLNGCVDAHLADARTRHAPPRVGVVLTGGNVDLSEVHRWRADS